MMRGRGALSGSWEGVALGGQDCRVQRRSRTHPVQPHLWVSTPHLAISTMHCFHNCRLLVLGFLHFHPKDGCVYWLIAYYKPTQTS